MFLARLRLIVLVSLLFLGAGGVGWGAFRSPVPADGRAAPRQGAPARADRHGDPLPPSAVARLGTLRLRHSGPAFFVAFLPEGKTLLSAGEERAICLWDLATDKLVRRIEVPYHSSTHSKGWARLAMNLSADGKVLAASAGDTTVHLWDVATGKERPPLKGLAAPVVALSLSADGGRLAVKTSNRTLAVYDLERRKLRGTIRLSAPPAIMDEGGGERDTGLDYGREMALSPDGKLLAVKAVDDTGTYLQLWAAAGGKLLHRVRAADDLFCPRFSPDGKLIAWTDLGGSIWLTSTASGRNVRRCRGKVGGILAVAFSADGKRLLSRIAGWSPVTVWDVEGKEWNVLGTARPGETSDFGQSTPAGLAVSPDGKTVACAGPGKVVRLLDVASGAERQPLAGHTGAVLFLRYSPDGKSLTSLAEDGTARSWDLATGRQQTQMTLPGESAVVALAPDGKLIVTADPRGGGVDLWEARTGKKLSSLKVQPDRGAVFTFSPDGRTLAARGLLELAVRLYDVRTGKERRRLTIPREPAVPGRVPPASPVTPPLLMFSPDGKLLASRTGRDIRVWEANTGRELHRLALPARRLADIRGGIFSPDSRSIALDFGGGVAGVWEVATGRRRAVFGAWRRGNTDSERGVIGQRVLAEGAAVPPALALAPDGKTLATIDPVRGVLLWDANTGKEVGQLRGHQGAVETLAFSPDGRTLATGSSDTTILIWDVAAVRGQGGKR